APVESPPRGREAKIGGGGTRLGPGGTAARGFAGPRPESWNGDLERDVPSQLGNLRSRQLRSHTAQVGELGAARGTRYEMAIEQGALVRLHLAIQIGDDRLVAFSGEVAEGFIHG